MREAIELLAKHLTKKPPAETNITCGICGSYGSGFKVKDVVSSNFTGWHYLTHGKDHICVNCQACLDSKSLNGKALRNYSFIATEDEMKVLQHSEIALNILNPPIPPFVFVVTYTHKKHAFLNAVLNDNRERLNVALEMGYVKFSRQVFIARHNEARKLYDAGFSKEEIRTGEYRKWRLLEEVGDEFWEVDRSLEVYRFTPFFNFLIHILQKGETNDQA